MKKITVKRYVLITITVLLLTGAGYVAARIARYQKDVKALNHILNEKNGAIATYDIVVDGLLEEVS